jgi:hypothetical protein
VTAMGSQWRGRVCPHPRPGAAERIDGSREGELGFFVF